MNYLQLAVLGFLVGQAHHSHGNPQTKYTPGHYIAVGSDQELAKVVGIRDPAIRGIIKRYSWATMEPARGEYDFNSVRSDLDELASIHKQLIVFIVDKTFTERDPNPIPSYMQTHSIENIKGGVTGKKWEPGLIDRQIALCHALSKAFDSKDHFEGIAYQESAPSIPREKLEEIGYTPELMRDGLTKLLVESSKAFPRSQVFWFMNFLPMNDGYLTDIAEAVVPYRVVMGGPDILPYRDGLQRTLPLYEAFNGRLKLFCSAQNDSYRHHRNDRHNEEKIPYHRGEKPIHPEGYVAMEEIFKYGRDTLHLNYIFWTYKTFPGKSYPGDPKQWVFTDALDVIRQYPTFNP
jgi:hypothetical protein